MKTSLRRPAVLLGALALLVVAGATAVWALSPSRPISDRDRQPPGRPVVDQGTAAGRVTDASGRAIVGGFIAVEAVDQDVPIPDIGIVTNEQGRYSTMSLPPGRYRITAGAQGYRSVTSEVRIDAGRATPLDFVLRPTA